jgi:hypothetical protein
VASIRPSGEDVPVASIAPTLAQLTGFLSELHGDLLHGNLLVTPRADAEPVIFSWKCSTWGDFLDERSPCR